MATKEETIEMLREEIAWHEAAGAVGYSAARPLPGYERASARYLKHYYRHNVSYVHSQAGALAEARAELAALTAPAPQTIEERFPRGCRVRVTRTSGASTEHTVTGHICDRFREGLATEDGPLWFIPGWTFERLDTPAPESAQPVPMVGDVWRIHGTRLEHVLTRVDQTGYVRAGEHGEYAYSDATELRRHCTFVRRAQPQPAPTPARCHLCKEGRSVDGNWCAECDRVFREAATPPKPAPQCEAPKPIEDRSDWRPRVVVLAVANDDDETVPVTVGAPFTRGEWAVHPRVESWGEVIDARPDRGDTWSVSYIPNGCRVATYLSFDAARALCEALGPTRDASPNRLGVRDRFSPGYERAAAIVAEMTGDDSELPL